MSNRHQIYVDINEYFTQAASKQRGIVYTLYLLDKGLLLTEYVHW